MKEIKSSVLEVKFEVFMRNLWEDIKKMIIYIYIYISVVQRRGRGTSLEVISR